MAETSAYLFAGGSNKTQACAHIRLSCRCFPVAYNISLRNFAAAKSFGICTCVKAHLIRVKNEDERVGSRFALQT